MTNNDNKALVQRFVRQVFSEGDGDASDAFLDRGFVDHQPWPGHPGTLEGFKAGLAEFRRAFPDLRFELERMVEEGDTVVALFTMSGTHLGPFMGAPGTGKTFRVQGMDMVRVGGGRLVEHWGFFDTEALGRQLGLAPS